MISYLGSGLAIAAGLWILSLVRGHRLMLKFALPWLTMSFFGFLFSASSFFRETLTKFAGFEQPSNLFFSVMVVALGFLGILLGIELTTNVASLEKSASAIAIIGAESEELTSNDNIK